MQRFSVESQQEAIRDVPAALSPLVTQASAARLTGLTRRQIAELVNAGHTESLQVGQRRMIPRRALASLIDRLTGVAA